VRGWRWPRGIRARFVQILLLAVIVPNVVLAVWIGRSARASALALLEAQLHETLASAAQTIGNRWIELRSPLLSLAEDARVVAALRDSVAGPVPLLIHEAGFAGAAHLLGPIRIVDESGKTRAEVEVSSSTREGTGSAAALPVQIPVYDEAGVRVGAVEASVSLATLLPPLYGWGAAAGAVPAILTLEGEPVVPVSIEPLLGSQRRFTWEGEEWLAAHRDVLDPRLRLAIAAPTSPHSLPFTDAARRGIAALLLVLGVSVLLTLLLTRSISVPLGRLTHAAEEVARGQLENAYSAEEGPDEIRRLARAFTSMSASLQRLIRRVSQQESAAAVGEFAASLAHEVRNPLTSVRLDLERARERLDRPAAAEELIDRALRQVTRLDATVSGALRIARSGSLELTVLDLRELLAAVHRTASSLFTVRAAKLAPLALPPEPLLVRGNAAAIEQMLLNVLINAADAVEARAGASDAVGSATGDPSVSMYVNECDREIKVGIEDRGRGMTAEELGRALEPFFTTRHEGTGLGLTVVKRIVEAHGAELEMESQPGVGTKVTVSFVRARLDLEEV
jgi:signal transduction histidine kinase